MSEKLNIGYWQDAIALHTGDYGTIWGPCLCPPGEYELGTCVSCLHAKKLEEEGKDWHVEYDKAHK